MPVPFSEATPGAGHERTPLPSSLTERQTQILAFIQDFLRQHQRPPTLREIGRALAIRSTNGVRKQLIALEEKGYLARTPGLSRGIEVVRTAAGERHAPGADRTGESPARAIPLLSKDAHSRYPNRLLDAAPDVISIDPSLRSGIAPESLLCARVGDNGMEVGGVLYGDLVMVEQVPVRELDEGESVAALIGETLVVRRFFVEDGLSAASPAAQAGNIRLSAGSSTVPDILFVPGSPDGHVLGRVRVVIRSD